ncbi:Hydroxyacylglutathione hydrolase [Zea mays]|uniref:Hydroxyacylglutathione hydrolase n=1 Tax=Zea mays TaxID=4577 RepID=A0A3L6FL10_MAIZE|nr:Hydroxyacylglutathione hydrolase [Zea mays]
MSGELRLLKYVEEAEFGPDAGINTVYIVGSLELRLDDLPESCKWMSKECALRLLSEAKPGNDRIGQYAYIGLLNSELSSNCTASPALPFQEYPPGITLVPMKSRTLAPFRTTNLVVVRSTNGAGGSTCSDFFASGEALLIDPGCISQVHAELADLIDSLPKRLLVLVTHHHQDHIEGLSVVQRCNPDAVLLTHQSTMDRIGKGTWQIDYTSVTGGEKICIGDQELQVVFAPGHTDGHMGLLHVNTNTLVVGDHCVGNRRAREASILQSIENGAQTLFDIVSKTYSDVDRKLWIPASFNVRLHVDHLNSLHKLPKDFSLENFKESCGVHFMLRWAVAYVHSRSSPAILAASALAGGLAIACALRRNYCKQS